MPHDIFKRFTRCVFNRLAYHSVIFQSTEKRKLERIVEVEERGNLDDLRFNKGFIPLEMLL